MSNLGFQVMPRLSADEYADLEADIIAHGVQVPITVTEDGRIVDGHHRDEIARKHQLHCPRVTATGSEDELQGLAFSLNLNRRHLNREQRRELIAESLRLAPQMSNREHARRTGASKTTVNSVRDEMQESGQIDHFSERVDPRTGNLSQAADRPRETALPQSDLDALNEEAPPSPDEPDDEEEAPAWEHVGTIRPADLPALKQDEPAPRAEPITNRFTSAVADLNKLLDRFHRIQNDPNFRANKNQVATLHGSDLARAISEIQTLADNLN